MNTGTNTPQLAIPTDLIERCDGLVDGLNCSVEDLILAILTDVTEDMENDETLHAHFVSSALDKRHFIRDMINPIEAIARERKTP